MMDSYQTFKGCFYVATNKTTEAVTIKDKDTQVTIGTIPAASQGLFLAIGDAIETSGDVVLTLVR